MKRLLLFRYYLVLLLFSIVIYSNSHALEVTPETTRLVLLQQANNYEIEKDYISAITIYKQILQTYQRVSSSEIFLHLGNCYLGIGDKVKAREYWLELINTAPQSLYMPEAYSLLAGTYSDESNYSTAIKIYRQLINNFPESNYSQAGWIKLGHCYQMQNRTTEAIKSYAHAIHDYIKNDSTCEAQFSLGSAYLSLKRTHPAKASDIAKTLSVTTVLQDALLLTGEVYYFQRDDFTEAEKYYKEIIDNYRGYYNADDAMMMLGRAMMKQKRNEDALVYFRALLTDFPPNNHQNEAQLEILCLCRETNKSSEEILDEAIKLTAYPEWQLIGLQTALSIYQDKKDITSATALVMELINKNKSNSRLNQYKELLDKIDKW